MASAVSIPQHKLLESPNSRTIEIYDWTITASTNPISNTGQSDTLQASVGFPLPEMTFGNNYLALKHKPSDWWYSFTTGDALRGVKAGELEEGDGGVKVGYADAWMKSRTDPGSSSPMPKVVATKPYDWTYTTTYSGHAYSPVPGESSDSPTRPKVQDRIELSSAGDEHEIPIAELTQPDPILFYAEIPLFEDELHDNGSSNLLVRIRVMPTCLFVLCRFTLRVDNVLFRTYDTRLYHSFSSSPPLVILESSGWEAPYNRVKRLPKRDDLTPLTDPTFIAKALSGMPSRASQGEGAGTRWRGLGTSKQIVVLKSS